MTNDNLLVHTLCNLLKVPSPWISVCFELFMHSFLTRSDAETHVGHEKCILLLSDFNQISNESPSFSKTLGYEIQLKSVKR